MGLLSASSADKAESDEPKRYRSRGVFSEYPFGLDELQVVQRLLYCP